MHRKKILFICGSLNQTTMMHKISMHLSEYDCFFTPFYCDGFYRWAQERGWLDFTIIGGQNRISTEAYFEKNKLAVDYAGQNQDYDLYVLCTDLIVPKNLKGRNVILVQEGMTDPENFAYHCIKYLRHLGLPIWLASTSTTGLSDCYTKFCVASEGYRRHFARKGVDPTKIEVTGIPNFDNAAELRKSEFPHQHYVLVATTDTRENFKLDFRKRFLKKAVQIAAGRQIIFKLHPNENAARSIREIRAIVPDALIFHRENTGHMIANCDVLITQYSSVVYLGLALGKEVHSYFDLDSLKEMLPIQNGGQSARNIAEVCARQLEKFSYATRANRHPSAVRLQSAAQ